MSRTSLGVLLLQLLATGLSAATVVLLARILSAEVYGSYVYYLTVTAILPLFAGLGGEHVFLMEASRDRRLLAALFGNAVFVRVVTSILIALGTAGLLYGWGVANATVVMLILNGGLLAMFGNPLFLSLYRVQGSHVRPWLLTYVPTLAFIGWLLVVPRSGNLLRTVALGYFAAQLLGSIVFAADVARRIRPRVDFALMRRSVRNGGIFSASQMFDYAFARLDILLLQPLVGAYAVGIYAAGQRVASLFHIIPSSFHIVELPEFHRAASTPAELTRRFRYLRRHVFELAVLAFGVLGISSEWLISLLFRPEYSSAAQVLVLLSIANLLLFTNYPYYMLAEAMDILVPRLVSKIITLVLTAIVIGVLAKPFGANAGALGLMFGQGVFIALLHYVTRSANGGVRALAGDLRTVVVAAPALLVAVLIGTLAPSGLVRVLFASGVYTALLLGVGGWIGLNDTIRSLARMLPSGSSAQPSFDGPSTMRVTKIGPGAR